MADDAPELQVTLASRVETLVWWAPVSRQLERIVAGLPIHRDTRSGRKNANQIRLAVLSAGILLVVLWQSPYAPLALLLCIAALFIPMSETRRRELVVRLRTARKQISTERRPATLRVTDKACVITCDGEQVARLPRRSLQLAKPEAGLELRAGSKKRERMLVATPDSSPKDEDRWLETTDVDALEELLS